MKNTIVTVVVALLISVGFGFYFVGSQSNLGGLSERDVKALSLTVGDNPTTARDATKGTKHLFGTCNLATTAGRLPLATSSIPFDCSAQGVRSGDNVRVALRSDGATLLGTFPILLTAYLASSTNDYIHVFLAHPTDGVSAAATSSFALASTSVMWEAWDN